MKDVYKRQGKPLCLERPGGGFGYDKIALVCLAVCGAGFLGFLRFQPLADGLGLGIGKYLSLIHIYIDCRTRCYCSSRLVVSQKP